MRAAINSDQGINPNYICLLLPVLFSFHLFIVPTESHLHALLDHHIERLSDNNYQNRVQQYISQQLYKLIV